MNVVTRHFKVRPPKKCQATWPIRALSPETAIIATISVELVEEQETEEDSTT